MTELCELLNVIEKRKSMYLVRSSVFDLYSLLLGIELTNPEFKNMGLLMEFQTWIAIKYKISSSQSWASMLNFFSHGEEKALDLFYKEWRQFLEDPNDLTFKKIR
jgi:hypothetical protein